MKTNRDTPAAPIYFLHIPKTAGSTVRSMLEACFGDRLCPAVMWDDFFRARDLRKHRFKAYSGHFGIDLPDFLQVDLRTFTMLREPVARTISHYWHVHRDTWHPLHRRVSKQSLEEFVFDPRNASMIFNVQARYLVSRDAEVDALAQRFSPYWGDRYSLSVAWEDASCYMDASVLETRAKEVLRTLAYIGTTERFDEDLPRMLHVLGLEAARPERHNVAPNRGTAPFLRPEVEERIRALTMVDAKLHAMANSSMPEEGRRSPER